MSGKFLTGCVLGVVMASLTVLAMPKPRQYQPDTTSIVELQRQPVMGKFALHCTATLFDGNQFLTAAHCTKDGPLTFERNGVRYKVVFDWVDEDYDLAQGHVEDAESLGPIPSVNFNCGTPAVGEWIVTTGYPGIGNGPHTFWGRVSNAPHRRGEPGRVDKKGNPIAWWGWVFVADIIGIGGQSGSAVWNMQGEVTGVLVGGWDENVPSIIVPGSTVCTLLKR